MRLRWVGHSISGSLTSYLFWIAFAVSQYAQADRVLSQTTLGQSGVERITFARSNSLTSPPPSPPSAIGMLRAVDQSHQRESNQQIISRDRPTRVLSETSLNNRGIERKTFDNAMYSSVLSRVSEEKHQAISENRHSLGVSVTDVQSIGSSKQDVVPPKPLTFSSVTVKTDQPAKLSSDAKHAIPKAESKQPVYVDSQGNLAEAGEDHEFITESQVPPYGTRSERQPEFSIKAQSDGLGDQERRSIDSQSDGVSVQANTIQTNETSNKPSLVQRFAAFFSPGSDRPELSNQTRSSVDSKKRANVEIGGTTKSFPVHIPRIRGESIARDHETEQVSKIAPAVTLKKRRLGEGNFESAPILTTLAVSQNSLPRLFSLKPQKVNRNDENSAELNPQSNGLNPLAIGLKLDTFALGLISDVRRGDGRRPFDEFSKQISDVFFAAPTVLRLNELERTVNTQVDEAQAIGRPQIGFSAEEGRRSVSDGGSDGRLSSQTISATQSVWDFGIIDSGIQQSRNNVDKTLAEIRDSRSEALLDLISAYNELATARLNMQLVEVFAETRLQFLDLVDQKLALGVSSQADLVRAEAKTYEAQSELPVAAQRLQAAEDRFVELFGVMPPATIPLYKLPANQLSLAELGMMTEGHPSVIIAQRNYENAQLSLQRLSSEKFGSVNFQLTGSRSDTPTTTSTDQVDGKLVYQVDLYDGGDLSARLERASGAVVEARWELERVRREIRRVLETAIAELVATQSLETARLNSLEATIKASEATKELFMYDRGDLTDIFRVQDDYLNAAKALVEARANSQNAFYTSLQAADLLIEQFGLGI